MSVAAGYLEASARLFDQAGVELEIGDVTQASEKYWGAAAQMVKAIAEKRGTPHRAHWLLTRFVRDLADDVRDDEINRLFRTAQQLHTNFYEHELELARVAAMAEDVRELLRRLRGIYDG